MRACPVITGKLKFFDASKAEKMPGVKKIFAIDGDAGRGRGRHLLAGQDPPSMRSPTEWNIGELGKVSTETISAMLKEGLDAKEAFVGNKAGDAQKAIDGAAKKVEARLQLPTSITSPWSR